MAQAVGDFRSHIIPHVTELNYTLAGVGLALLVAGCVCCVLVAGLGYKKFERAGALCVVCEVLILVSLTGTFASVCRVC